MAITKIQSESLNLADDFAFTGTITGAGGVNTPAFRANVDDQSGFNTSWKKVEFDKEVFDTDGCYDNTTNYRFTPTSAGKYLLTFMIYFNGSASTSYQIGTIYKNGSQDTYAQISISVGSGGFDNGVSGSVIVEANGTTDYFEIYAIGGSGTRDIYRGTFSGFKIIE